METFHIVHDFDTTPELFWELFFLPEYNRSFYGSVGLTREVTQRSEANGALEIQARYVSARPLPDFVTRALRGRRLGFSEALIYRASEQRAVQTITPDFFQKQVRFRGEIEVKALASGGIRRVYRGSLGVSVPILGRKVEQATLQEMQRTHDQAAEVTRAWLQKNYAWREEN